MRQGNPVDHLSRIARLVLLFLMVTLGAACSIQVDSDGDRDSQTNPQREQGTVSLRIVEGPQGSVLALVPVFINDQGPFGFALDTGASRSLVDRDLVDELQLPITGSVGEVTGVGGRTDAELVRVESWRLGEEVGLPATELATLDMPEPDRGRGLQGLIGSDMLSTFGTITINYEAEVLTLRSQAEQQVTPTP